MSIITRLCARWLSRRAHRSDRKLVKAKARQMRRELGLPKSRALR